MKLIDAKTAQIEWATNDDLMITDLVIFDRDAISERQKAIYERKYISSNGACVGGWMEGKRAASTPEGQFALKLMDGFFDEQTMLVALDQFGQIHEASWARTMAEAIREELRGRCGDDEEAAEAIVSVTYE